MCTVTYLPLSDGCLITSNRDEALARDRAEFPAVHHYKGQALLFPKDPRGKGSWIASNHASSVCLFNGAFEAHVPAPPYRHSRGLIPLEVLSHDTLDDFVVSHSLEGIEPFSIVVYRPGVLQELKWDGQKPHVLNHDSEQPHIWASATLYSKEVRTQRQRDFETWLRKGPEFTQANIVGFHTQGSEDHDNGLLIARDSGLQTVSVTSMKHTHDAPTEMIYHDLITQERHTQSLGN